MDARLLHAFEDPEARPVILAVGGDASLKNIVAQRHADVGHDVVVMADRGLKMHASGTVTAGPSGRQLRHRGRASRSCWGREAFEDDEK